jgi:2,3-diketo-5-methylthio-1-phosphopentane phosphatase
VKILVSDFDSTFTRLDFYDLVRKRWPPPPTSDPWERYVAGKITHFDALAEIFAGIRATEAELAALAREMDLDPAAAVAVRKLEDTGWEVIVASAGCSWYIDRLLGSAGISLKVHASPGVFHPETGLRMTPPESSPFLNRETGIDKVAILEDAIERADVVAFAGDGRPDLAPALLVAPERRFARGWLAGELVGRGEGFQSFDRWSEIAQKLTG